MAKPPNKRTWRDILAVHGSALVFLAVAFAVAYQYVDPAPPDRITIAAGPSSGVYFRTAQSYRRILAGHGVTLEVIETEGSVENLARLVSTGTDRADIAFVQGGVRPGSGDRGAADSAAPAIESLASMYFEPIWAFHREDMQLTQLRELGGRRIAVGSEGSGTRALALKLLASNGITDDNAELVPANGQSTLRALVDGEVDCVFLVAGADSALVGEYITEPGIALLSLGRAEAYVRQHPFLSSLVLPEGAIDLAANVPQDEVKMIATSANLVAPPTLHPALVDLLLIAANEVHDRGGIFESPGQFPSEAHIDFALNSDARRFFKYGPPFLMRVLPFWAATWADRLKIMLLPLLALLLPLARVLPPVYRWRVRSRIYRWYRDLGAIEAGLHEDDDARTAGELLASLERIDHEVRQVTVPGAYEEEHYHLRVHIDFVRERIERAMAAQPAAQGTVENLSR